MHVQMFLDWLSCILNVSIFIILLLENAVKVKRKPERYPALCFKVLVQWFAVFYAKHEQYIASRSLFISLIKAPFLPWILSFQIKKMITTLVSGNAVYYMRRIYVFFILNNSEPELSDTPSYSR